MIETPEILDIDEQPTAVVHLKVARDAIQGVMGPAIEEVLTVLSSQGIATTGPLFDHHLLMDPTTFDFDVGFPVATTVEPEGRVIPAALPGGRVVRTVYHGAYEGLGDAWGEFDAWLAANDVRHSDELWERFIAGPESSKDPTDWRTELVRPLA